jgi:hypothetical protein
MSAPPDNPHSPAPRHEGVDWRQRAQDAWNDPGWREAAADYHRQRGNRTLIVEIASHHRSAAPQPTVREHKVWRAAGLALRRWKPTEALKVFLQWCRDQRVNEEGGRAVFAILLEKEARRVDRD